MKKLHKKATFLLWLTLALTISLPAQEKEKPELLVSIGYYNINGQLQYLKVKTMSKETGKLQPVKDAVLKLYLDEVAAENLIGSVKTGESGEAKSLIPVSLKEKWTAAASHTFYAVSEATKKYGAATAESAITKAMIVIDTLNEDGARKVSAKVMAFQDSSWQAVKDVELKIGVRRLSGDLKIGEEETYTTDSLGLATGEFMLDKLPAPDANNSIVLVAKTEENETYGNLRFEKNVPWGQFANHPTNFDKRSLWGTSDKAPLWLLFMAGLIIAGVWGVIAYLLLQILEMKKAGKNPPAENEVPQKRNVSVVQSVNA